MFTGSGNPLAGRAAFVQSSFGYTGTRLDLTPLVGQSVKFRFRIGADINGAGLGWSVDNVAIYACAVVGPPSITSQPSSQTIAFASTASLAVDASGGGLSYQWYAAPSGVIANPVGTNSSSYTTAALTNNPSTGPRVEWERHRGPATAQITVAFTDRR